ncbi:MAG: hypothetical protein GY749_19130 [Desulfobacteraceae bacterium]|nr:hypothetical protein [Desulfobacteraceae bacterium]
MRNYVHLFTMYSVSAENFKAYDMEKEIFSRVMLIGLAVIFAHIRIFAVFFMLQTFLNMIQIMFCTISKFNKLSNHVGQSCWASIPAYSFWLMGWEADLLENPADGGLREALNRMSVGRGRQKDKAGPFWRQDTALP